MSHHARFPVREDLYAAMTRDTATDMDAASLEGRLREHIDRLQAAQRNRHVEGYPAEDHLQSSIEGIEAALAGVRQERHKQEQQQ